MSSGKSGNPFPNIVKDFITPGPKRSKRIAERKGAGRSSSLPRSSQALPSSSGSVPTNSSILPSSSNTLPPSSNLQTPNLSAQPPVDINSSSYPRPRTTIGDLDSNNMQPSAPAEVSADVTTMPDNQSSSNINRPNIADQQGSRQVPLRGLPPFNPESNEVPPSSRNENLENELRELRHQNEEFKRRDLQTQIRQEREILRTYQDRIWTDIESPQYIPTRETLRHSETPRYMTSPRENVIWRQTITQRDRFNKEMNSYPQFLNLSDSTLRWLKAFKFDIEDAKEQFLYFEERMADHGIVDNTEKYWVLREFWPNNDLSAYMRCTAPEDRNYNTLRAYLLEKDGVLPCVLLPKKQFNSVSGCDLNDEVSKWGMELENRETLYKFLFLHLSFCLV